MAADLLLTAWLSIFSSDNTDELFLAVTGEIERVVQVAGQDGDYLTSPVEDHVGPGDFGPISKSFGISWGGQENRCNAGDLCYAQHYAVWVACPVWAAR